MARQLGFDLPSRTALGRDAFFVAPSNAMAAALIDGWESWPGGKLVLSGPPGSGKTHLAHVWAAAAGSTILPAADLAKADIPALARGAVAVEDVPTIAGDAEAETALFHLHNLVLAEGHALLLTGTAPVARWQLSLPDLVSRMRGTTEAALEPPDDALLAAVLVKMLADRQLSARPEVIAYLVSRMDRSFAAAGNLVERLDAASLAQKRGITRNLAAEVLDNSEDRAR